MKWKILFNLICGCVLSLGSACAEGKWEQSLNGPWQFSTNPETPSWDSITVPGNWDTLPQYSTHSGKGWYRREFVAPADWKGKRIRLKFDAVYHEAHVTLNGHALGSHVGGYTPFEFDVTEVLKLGTTNSVTVCADNTYRRGAWWPWGGISRSVTLIANHDARIVRQHIRSEPDLATGTAKVFVRYKLANSSGSPLEGTLTSDVDGTQEPVLTQKISIPAHSEVEVAAETFLPKSRVRLWHFDHPNLYRLTTRLSVGGKLVHEQSDRFGIRKVELTQDSLLLNGERVRLNGFNRVSDSRKFGNTEPDELVKADVDLMKRANANLTRLMHMPQAPNLLDELDEKGMMIWCEIPVWGGDDPQIKGDNAQTRQWMREMIERDYNHPCIIGWSVGNEMRNHLRYCIDMQEFTRSLDPHRIVTHVSNSRVSKNMPPESDALSLGPVMLYNKYASAGHVADALHHVWPQKPIFFSEFGTKQFGGGTDRRIEGLEAMYQQLTANQPYVIGVSLWTFNDYRSGFEGTPASGNREWGIVTEDRKPKAAYQQVRELFSPVRSLTLKDGLIRLEPRGPEEVPSFTLRGYKLKWDGGEIALPDIKPGDPVWRSTKPLKPETAVKLYTPTGYDVADSQ
jgi:hypothetical protein